MLPAYRVRIDDVDITAVVDDRLISLVVSDESGYQSDSASLVIDDRDGRVALPRRGVRMQVEIGYRAVEHQEGQENQEEQAVGLVSMGSFTVDEVVPSGPPDIITIRARAIDFRETLKQRKTRAWEDTIGSIVSSIAGEHSLQPRVHADLAGISVPHIDQTEESDLAFLTRLGRRYDAAAKPAGSSLMFVPLGRSESATGRPTNIRTIHKKQANRHRAVLADRSRFQSVRAHWRDLAQGSQETVSVGQGDPVDTLPRTYPTEAEARAAATSRLNELNRDKSSLTLTLHPGDPLVSAGARLTVIGFRTGINGEWIATRVIHNLIKSTGYTTRLTAQKPTGSLA